MTEPLFAQFAAFLAAALMIPVVVFFAHGVNHRTMPFWWLAAAGYLGLFLGAVLGALRDVLPVVLYGLTSNILFGLGYFFSLQALRAVKNERIFARADWVIGVIYIAAAIAIFATANTYANRVALVSLGSGALSLLSGFVAYQNKSRISPLGDALFVLFSAINVATTFARAAAALSNDHAGFINLALWDPVFFFWAIAAVFCFAIALFINGTAALSLETKNNLIRQRETALKLAEALEGQRNLQKLMLHEVKRPLNAISAAVHAANTIGSGMQPAEIKKLTELTRDANTYLESIGAFEELNALVDSPDVVRLAVSRIARDMASKWDARIALDDNAASAWITADPLMMDIALGNLIENAHKFGKTRQGTRVIISREGNMVAFDVSDDGPGIAPGEQKNVFGKFYKVGSTSANALKGCGLGLYVVQQIAKAHHGTCRVLSQSPSTLRLAIPTDAAKGA